MTGVLTGSSLGEEVEVVAKATRRRFTAAYRRRILQEAERCTKAGEIGALLRREGLYSSNLTAWRAARARREFLAGDGTKRRGPQPKPPSADVKGILQLERENRRRLARAERAAALVEVQKTLGPPAPQRQAEHRAQLMQTVTELGTRRGVRPACTALGVAPASYYNRRQPPEGPHPRSSPRALWAAERQAVLDVLHEERFVDVAPGEVVATLLDEERYLCSERTMYRLLAAHQEVREPWHQRRHPSYAAPELLATRPNELWSWDITKLKGPAKWV